MGIWHADFDNDGDLDLVTTVADNTNMILMNDGTGGFLSPVLITGARMTDIEIIDFDQDGFVDLVGVERYAGYNRGISVRLNDGS